MKPHGCWYGIYSHVSYSIELHLRMCAGKVLLLCFVFFSGTKGKGGVLCVWNNFFETRLLDLRSLGDHHLLALTRRVGGKVFASSCLLLSVFEYS